MAELFVHDFAAPVVTWLVILITGGSVSSLCSSLSTSNHFTVSQTIWLCHGM
jgi:hypothetical protein